SPVWLDPVPWSRLYNDALLWDSRYLKWYAGVPLWVSGGSIIVAERRMEQQPSRMEILWSFGRPHLRTLAFGLVLALIGSATALASPMVTKWVLDSLE